MKQLKTCNTLLALSACAVAFELSGCTHPQNQFPKVPLRRLEKNVQIDKNAVQQAEEPTLFPFEQPCFKIIPATSCNDIYSFRHYSPFRESYRYHHMRD